VNTLVTRATVSREKQRERERGRLRSFDCLGSEKPVANSWSNVKQAAFLTFDKIASDLYAIIKSYLLEP